MNIISSLIADSARVPVREQRRFLREQNGRYGAVLTEVPRSEWPDLPPNLALPVRVLRSRCFLVQEFKEGEYLIRLSVNRTEINNDYNFKDGISCKRFHP